MSDMPSWWVGGNPNTAFQNNLAQNQAAMGNNQNFFTGLQNIGAQNQASLNNAYGPSGFGGDTARYAGIGAAFGRATGGFGGGAKPSVFDTGADPVPYFEGGGMPFGGGGFGGGGGNRDAIAGRMADAFRQFGQTPAQAQNQPAIDAVQQFSGRGTGVAPEQPYFTPPSEGARGAFGTRFDAAPQGGAGSPGSFADRFAPMMRGNPGTPSQYYTGSQYPQAQQPPAGYETLFGADNPRGALPVGGFRR